MEHFATFPCALLIFTMDFFQVFIIIFELMICTTYFARYQANGAQLPVDQEHIDQLVANDNSDSVTISNQKQIVKGHAVSTAVVAKDNDTDEWYDQNVVTSDNNLTTQAVTNDNNVSVTTDVATVTIPALQQYHHHDNDYIKFHQPDNLKPRSGLDLQNNQPDILLQHSKSVEEFTSSDFVIKGHDITPPNPDDTTDLDADTNQDSQINNRDHQSDYSTSDHAPSITDLSLESTSTRSVAVSSGDDKGSFLDPTTTATTYLSSVLLEHGNTLRGFTKQNTNPSTQNIQSESAVVDHTTSQPSLFITLLLSSSASPSFEEENQANSSPGYSTHGQHEEVSTIKVADVFTSLDKHAVTKRETPSIWDAVSYETTAPSGHEGYLTTPKSEIFVPPETPYHSTTLTNHKLDDISSNVISSSSSTPSSGSGEIIDNGLQGQGQTTAPGQGQPLTSSTHKTNQVGEVPRKSTTTTMVYVASSDVTDNGNNLFDGFDGLDGRSDFKVKDIILGVSGTVGCMLTVCMLVAFTRCCCKKEKDDEEEETGGATSGTLKALRSLGRKSKHRSSKSDVTTPSGGGGRESATDVTQVTISVTNTKEQQNTQK